MNSPHFLFFCHHKTTYYIFYIHIFCSDFNPEWLTADAAEKPAVLLYFLSFWCLDWADSNPMSHRRKPVPPWLPQWHAVLSLGRLHNSLRLLLSHQPCFMATVISEAVSYNKMMPISKVLFWLGCSIRQKTHIHAQNQWGKTENESNEVGSMKKGTNLIAAWFANHKLWTLENQKQSLGNSLWLFLLPLKSRHLPHPFLYLSVYLFVLLLPLAVTNDFTTLCFHFVCSCVPVAASRINYTSKRLSYLGDQRTN